MVMDLLLTGVDTAGVVSAPGGAETGAGVAAKGSAGGHAGDEAGAGACWVGRAARAPAELDAALGLRMVSMSSAVAPALLSRIISAVERSNRPFFDDLTSLTITELGPLACSRSSTPWLFNSESDRKS